MEEKEIQHMYYQILFNLNHIFYPKNTIQFFSIFIHFIGHFLKTNICHTVEANGEIEQYLLISQHRAMMSANKHDKKPIMLFKAAQIWHRMCGHTRLAINASSDLTTWS